MKKVPAVLSITLVLLLTAAGMPANAASKSPAFSTRPASSPSWIGAIVVWILGSAAGTSGYWGFPSD